MSSPAARLRELPLTRRLGLPAVDTATWVTVGFGVALALVAFVSQGGLRLGRTTTTEIGLTLGGGALAAAAVLVAPAARRAWGLGTLTALVALAAVTTLSIIWSVQPADSWVEANRAVSYVAALAAGIALARLAPRHGRALAGAVALGCVLVCAWALLTKVFPGALNRHEYHGRLRAPFDYWNAIGLEAALAVPALLWLGARREVSERTRSLVYPALGVVMLTLLLSYSRGAILALGLGAGAWFALVPLRLRALRVGLVATAGAGVVAAWAFTQHNLTKDHIALGDKAHSGHLLGLLIVVMCVALFFAGGLAERRLDIDAWPERTRRGVAGGVLGAIGVAVLVLALSGGGPSARWHSLTNADVPTPPNEPSRLTDSSSVRARYWREATQVWKHHRWIGAGAGGFATARTRYRHDELQVRHAHGYVVQTLADLGLIGLLASLAVLAAWLAAAARALGLRRRRAGAPPTPWPPERVALTTLAATVVVFGVSSLVDWTYLIPGNAVIALVGAGYVAARPPWGEVDPDQAEPGARPARAWMAPTRLAPAIGIALVALVASWVILQPVRSDNARDDALSLIAEGKVPEAEASARAARERDPLDVEPLFALNVVDDVAGRRAAALDDLRRAVRLQPANPRTWRELGDYELTIGRPRQALSALNAAVFLDPRSSTTQGEFLRAYRAAAATPAPPARRNPAPARGSS